MKGMLPELLAPSGGREQLEAALLYGADAVYLGGQELSLRTQCAGFDGPALAAAVRDSHAAGAKVYYCLNAMPYDRQLHAVCARLESLPELGVDGLIAADPGVIWLARRYCPTVDLHLSTQAHSVNEAAVAFWREAGARRVNVARELPQAAIRRLIRTFPDMEFEVFVHGAMCLALSGHCLLSAWANGRPANQGRCTQPCRFDYRAVRDDIRWTRRQEAQGLTLTVEEHTRLGQPFWDVEEGEDFSGIWAPQDICLARYADWLARSGAAALKLEGRTKSGGYVAQVVDVYRSALAAAGLRRGLEPHGRRMSAPVAGLTPEACVRELAHTASRPLSTGFFFPRRKVESLPDTWTARPVVARLLAPASGPQAVSAAEAAGMQFLAAEAPALPCVPCASWHVQVRSLWDADKDVTLLLPGMHRPLLRAGSYALENHRGERVTRLHSGTAGVLHCALPELRGGLYLRA